MGGQPAEPHQSPQVVARISAFGSRLMQTQHRFIFPLAHLGEIG
jgi:hypothetical protein